MARRKHKRSTSKVAGTCKNYRINGKLRTLCFNTKGKIKSNRPAR